MLAYFTETAPKHIYYDWRHMKDSGASQHKRIHTLFQHARDYAYLIFERYERRFGCLSDYKATIHIDKIMDRKHWFSRAHVYYTSHNVSGIRATGDFCPIGKIGHYDSARGRYFLHECPDCGSTMSIAKGVVYECNVGDKHSDIIYMSYVWRANVYPGMLANTKVKQVTCDNSQCQEVTEFMTNTHKHISPAKKLGVHAARPLKKYNTASAEERLVLATAAFLDFEARYLNARNQVFLAENGVSI